MNNKKTNNIKNQAYSLLASLGCEEDIIKRGIRAQEVREMWAKVVEKIFLDHTNAVFLLLKEGEKTLIVYVDESIFAAELNGRRELIKLKFLELFNENIDNFEIYISRGAYKKNYPYKKNPPSYQEQAQPVPLTDEEVETLFRQSEVIKNKELRNSLLKAMVSDLEWKKGINEK